MKNHAKTICIAIMQIAIICNLVILFGLLFGLLYYLVIGDVTCCISCTIFEPNLLNPS